MRRILTRLALVLALAAVAPVITAADSAWQTNYQAAVAAAAKTKKPLLLDFTGSDWCGWCKKLKKEVFDTPAFATWAKSKVVLVEVDFPNHKPQSAAEKKQNDELAKRFNIEGYPTIVILDPSGTKVLGTLGYEDGGPEAWTKHADAIIAGTAK